MIKAGEDLKFKYKTDLTVEECKSNLKKHMDLSYLIPWKNGFSGFVIGKYYRFSYYKPERSKILNGFKVINGAIYSQNGITYVTVKITNVYTDVGNIVFQLILGYGILFLFTDLYLISAFKYAIAAVAFIYVIGCILERRKISRKDSLALLEFISRMLQLKSC